MRCCGGWGDEVCHKCGLIVEAGKSEWSVLGTCKVIGVVLIHSILRFFLAQ